MQSTNPHTIESNTRRLAKRRGYSVYKSRQQEHSNNRGAFQLVDWRNTVVLGVDYDASLSEIAEYLRDKPIG